VLPYEQRREPKVWIAALLSVMIKAGQYLASPYDEKPTIPGHPAQAGMFHKIECPPTRSLCPAV